MGKLIVMEGSDRSGKSTQAKMLADYLRNQGKTVVQLSFPTKTNNFGQELRRWLQGAVEYEPMAINLLFEADRFQELPNLRNALESFDYVIVDRFWRTGIAYACYRGSPLTWSLQVSNPYVSEFAPQEILVNLRRGLDSSVIAGQSEGERYDEATDLESVFTRVIDALDVIAPPKEFILVETQQRSLFADVVMDTPNNVHYNIVDALERKGVIEPLDEHHVQDSTTDF